MDCGRLRWTHYYYYITWSTTPCRHVSISSLTEPRSTISRCGISPKPFPPPVARAPPPSVTSASPYANHVSHCEPREEPAVAVLTVILRRCAPGRQQTCFLRPHDRLASSFWCSTGVVCMLILAGCLLALESRGGHQLLALRARPARNGAAPKNIGQG